MSAYGKNALEDGTTEGRPKVDPLVEHLRVLRIQADLSQRDLATHLHLADPRSIGKYERGQATPTLPTLTRWARGLGYTLTLTPEVDQ